VCSAPRRFLWRGNFTWAISRHYARFDIFVEAERNKAAGKYSNASIDEQTGTYRREGMTPYSQKSCLLLVVRYHHFSASRCLSACSFGWVSGRAAGTMGLAALPLGGTLCVLYLVSLECSQACAPLLEGATGTSLRGSYRGRPLVALLPCLCSLQACSSRACFFRGCSSADVPEGCVIIRELVPLTNLLACLWFNEVERFTSRDQISFGFCRDKVRAGVPGWNVDMFLDCERRNFVVQVRRMLEPGRHCSACK